MRKAISLFLLFLLTWPPLALAGTPPLTEATPIPGLRQVFARVVFQNSARLLGTLQNAFRNHVNVGPKNPLVREEIECALAKLCAGFVQDMMLNPPSVLTPDDVKGLPDALAHYRAREAEWCRPPPGAPSNRGAELVALFIKRNTEGMPQARTVTEKYSARAEKVKGADLTARDVALAVAVALAIAAKEAVPLPVP
ncbi:hypothetical protein JY651_08080 [Pyxidicoccus parkwayensis]|uniref:Uncharacterized protein n=1 Tax=Pyxidicoccus parkwayensis TaxID=2813578 RepID=A0ABX7P359_9BACT|nr:hypothetical protein [Pyxidicoccus parkwaysis]QSQ24885.1 hypothetical protein JY651_08080 [Pyxidicoccus parkwaysis]